MPTKKFSFTGKELGRLVTIFHGFMYGSSRMPEAVL